MAQSDYLVRARSRDGRLVESTISAVSEADALAKTKSQGLTPLAVEKVQRKGLNREIRLTKQRVSLADMALFCRQFATMLQAGLPILRCLSILAEQSTNSTMSESLIQITNDVEQGEPLSSALAKHRQFPPLMVSMVRAGEVGGFLDVTMVEIAESLEADAVLRSRIKAALTYPIAVGIIAILIAIGMLIFVVPIFEEMFVSFGGSLPAPTQFLVTLSNLLTNPLVFIPTVIAIAAAVIWYGRHRHDASVRNVVDPVKFRMPVFGPLFQKVAIARFSRNLATLLSAGVPVLTALDIVQDTAGNVVIARAVADVKESVREGTGMAGPLSDHPVFPDMVVQMIAVGEDTGAIDEMLRKIADFYDQQVAATTEQLTALIEPIMIVVLGGLVGGMIIALYLPIFQIFDLVK